jgi:hypothetical protein
MPTFSPRVRRRFGARAHQHDHALGARIADVLEQAITPAGQFGERSHRTIDGLRTRVVEPIRRLTRLKKHIRVLGGSPQHRTIRRQPAPTMRVDR